MKTIGLQLYSVRDAATKDYAETIRKVAAMGYKAVEPAGYPGTDVRTAAALFKKLGLKVRSYHGKLPLGADQDAALAEAKALGAEFVVSGRGTKEFATVESIKAVAQTFNEAVRVAADQGLKVAYHNHWWEYLEIDGVPAYRILLDHVCPELFFQLDAYWVKVAGKDPVEVLKELKGRVMAVHIKDGACDRTSAMMALGTGKLDIVSLVRSDACPDALIVELDRCDTDMLVAVEQSYRYLASLLR